MFIPVIAMWMLWPFWFEAEQDASMKSLNFLYFISLAHILLYCFFEFWVYRIGIITILGS